MATTSNKNLNLPAAGTTNWDGPVNANFTSIDNAFGGSSTFTVTSVTSTQAISLGLAQAPILIFSGTLGVNLIYTLPVPAPGGGTPIIGGTWVVRNETTNGIGGPYTITISPITGAGTSVIVPQGQTRTIYSDGINVKFADEQASFFDPGVVMLFAQTTAPTGWVKSTTHNNKALRVVSGAAGSGGTVDFTTAFSTQTITGNTLGTALTVSQIPAHTHTFTAVRAPISTGGGYVDGTNASNPSTTSTFTTNSTGSGATHSHGLNSVIDLNVQYVDVIIATKS